MNKELRIMSHIPILLNVFMIGILASCLLTLASSQPVHAQTPTLTTRQEIRQEIKTLKETLRGKIMKLEKATITALGSSGDGLTVSNNGKTYLISIISTTNLRRHYFGKASFSEFQVNDLVDIIGTYVDDAGTTIHARLIRDVSIMKRRGVFFGTVSAKTDTTITLASKERGAQTITVSSNTRYLNQKGVATTIATINLGDTIRVRGLWDKANNTVTEVTEIKDFSKETTSTPIPTQ